MQSWFEWAQEHTAGWPDISEVPEGVRLNLGCGKVILPNDEGWVNVDHNALEGVDKAVDLFTFPWPFEDNYADYMIASHIVEHIPHQVMLKERVTREVPLTKSTITETITGIHPLDGFFAFFAEAWRILKPDGVICVICPYGRSTVALQDPTHTRSILEGTFSYLGAKESQTFDYGLPLAFSLMHGSARLFIYEGEPMPDSNEGLFAQKRLWDAIHSIRVDLRRVPVDKSPSPEAQ